MTDYKELEDYFENLAKLNVYIKHVPDDPEKKKFYRIDVEEYLTNIDSAKYPFLSLERAEFSLSGPNNDNISKNRTVAFMIVGHFANNDFDAQNVIYDATEKQGVAFINRILKDVENLNQPKLLRDLKAASITLQHLPANPVEKYCGVRVTMGIQSRYDKTVNPDDWSDLT
jgi:hypothetical protein